MGIFNITNCKFPLNKDLLSSSQTGQDDRFLAMDKVATVEIWVDT